MVNVGVNCACQTIAQPRFILRNQWLCHMAKPLRTMLSTLCVHSSPAFTCSFFVLGFFIVWNQVLGVEPPCLRTILSTVIVCKPGEFLIFSLPRFCAWQDFPFKSRHLRLAGLLAHNLIHRRCAELYLPSSGQHVTLPGLVSIQYRCTPVFT